LIATPAASSRVSFALVGRTPPVQFAAWFQLVPSPPPLHVIVAAWVVDTRQDETKSAAKSVLRTGEDMKGTKEIGGETEGGNEDRSCFSQQD
jgi:hypothetical protein